MVKCAVPTCKNDSRRQNKINSNVSFHRFPKNRKLIDAWVNAIRRPSWEPNTRSFVCSIHFNSSFISESKKGLRLLTQNAVPELHLEDNNVPSTSTQLSATASEDAIGSPDSPVSIPEEDIPDLNDLSKLKRQLKHIHEVAKRRRLRCNALYTQKCRLNQKINCLTELLTDLRKKQMITPEQNDILKMCWSPANELFKNDEKDFKSESLEHLPTTSKSSTRVNYCHTDRTHLEACRICLATDLRMYSLQHTTMKHYFESIIGSEEDISGLLQNVCYVCAAQLSKCYNFIVKYKKSKEILDEMIVRHGQINYSLIKNVSNDAKIKSSLASHKTTPTFTFDFKYDEDGNISRLTNSEYICDFREKVKVKYKQENQPDTDFEGVSHVKTEPLDDDSKKTESSDNTDNDKVTNDLGDIFVEIEMNECNADEDVMNSESDNPQIESADNSEDDSKTASNDDITTSVAKEKKSRRRKTNLVDGLTPDEVTMKEHFNIVKLTTLEQQIEEWKKITENPTLENSPGAYKCKECPKVFSQLDTYQSHIRYHDPSRGKAQCPVCKIWFRNDVYVRSHTNRIHGRKFYCRICPKVYTSVSAAKIHQRHHAGEMLKCERCSFATMYSSTLSVHVLREHAHALACADCGRACVSEHSLRQHRALAHSGRAGSESNQEHRCESCNLSFKTQNALRVHLLNSIQHRESVLEDPSVRNACRQCGVDFPDARALEAHLSQKHRRRGYNKNLEVYPNRCQHCGESVNSRREQWWHMRRRHPQLMHTYEPVVGAVCDACGKGFQSESQLRYHEARHGSPRERCPQCGRMFYDRAALGRHARSAHSALRPYACHACPRAFKVKGNLARHLLIHTGELPYECTMCGRKFRQPSSLKLHVRTVHHKLPHPPRKKRKPKTARNAAILDDDA